MDPQVIASFAQFGAAGLIGWMWLTERRQAVVREQQLGEAHAKLMRERESLDVLVAALRENTRALSAIEVGQRSMLGLLGRIGRMRSSGWSGNEQGRNQRAATTREEVRENKGPVAGGPVVVGLQ